MNARRRNSTSYYPPRSISIEGKCIVNFQLSNGLFRLMTFFTLFGSYKCDETQLVSRLASKAYSLHQATIDYDFKFRILLVMMSIKLLWVVQFSTGCLGVIKSSLRTCCAEGISEWSTSVNVVCLLKNSDFALMLVLCSSLFGFLLKMCFVVDFSCDSVFFPKFIVD